MAAILGVHTFELHAQTEYKIGQKTKERESALEEERKRARNVCHNRLNRIWNLRKFAHRKKSLDAGEYFSVIATWHTNFDDCMVKCAEIYIVERRAKKSHTRRDQKSDAKPRKQQKNLDECVKIAQMTFTTAADDR